jgi:hypothetical protein
MKPLNFLFLLLCQVILMSTQETQQKLPVAEKVFQRCWRDNDFLKMFTEPTCHLSWISHLKNSPIVAIDHVFELADSKQGDGDGSFRVAFSDGTRGIFKACNAPGYAWQAETIAYHVDRGLNIHRTPASVVRTLSWPALLALQPYGDVKQRLLRIKDKCSSSDSSSITGLMQGMCCAKYQKMVEIFIDFN